MAKRPDAKTPERQDAERNRVTIHLDVEWSCCLKHLAAVRKKTMSDLAQMMIQKELAGLPRAEGDIVRNMVKLECGKSLRLDNGVKGSSENTQQATPQATGQGGGDTEQAFDATETHSTVNPPGRLEKIAEIRRKAVEDPVDDAIQIHYN